MRPGPLPGHDQVKQHGGPEWDEQCPACWRAKADRAEAALVRLIVVYGLGVPCDRCGAPAMSPCMSERGRATVHSPRVTAAYAAISTDGER